MTPQSELKRAGLNSAGLNSAGLNEAGLNGPGLKRAGLNRAGLHWPALHWASVRGRARADAGPLTLVAVVVAVVSLLVGAVPPLLVTVADAAVRDSVRRAGSDAAVLVHAPWPPDEVMDGRVRDPELAQDANRFRDRALGALDPGLRSALSPPIVTATSISVKITEVSVPLTFQVTYLADDRGPAVTWLAGGPPLASVPPVDSRTEVPYNGAPWPVQVGVSEANAAALHLAPGDHVPLKDNQEQVKDVRVSGIFRADDEADPAWRLAPWLLHAVPGLDGAGTSRLGGLLSPDSLPDARLAFAPNDLPRTVWFSPDPDVLTWNSAQAIAATVIGLKATSGSSSGLDTSLKWETRLDDVLRDVREQVRAVTAQASVLLIGVLVVAVLVLLLAADLLVRRRTSALGTARRRGVSLPDLGAELLLESTIVAVAGAAVGLALAGIVTPAVAWPWSIPLVLAAAVAGPAFGTLSAARATRYQRAAANRSARRWVRRTGQLRRAAAETAVVIAAVVAFVALYQRGLGDGSSTLPASAPALGALAGALVLLRLLPVGTRLLLGWALRSTHPLAVFGAARAAATAGRAIPLLALVTSAALASFGLTVAATSRQGLVDGAWSTVGADARLDFAPAALAAAPTSMSAATAPSTPSSAPESVPAVAGRIAAAPGVRQTVIAQVTDGTRVVADPAILSPRLVIVDAAALRRLLADTPLADVPDLDRLGPAGADGVPALVRSRDGGLRPGMRLELLRPNAPSIMLRAVGIAPAVDDAEDVVLVDAGAAAAAGLPTVPNTVWATGPGAAQAITANQGTATAVVRADVLRARQAAPLTAGLLRLAWTAAALLLALGLLGMALAAAAGAPGRWQTLARLRTLGLRTRDARWVAAWELLPPVLLAAVAGPGLGVLLARLTLGPLALRRLTGQVDDPAVVLPWSGLGLVVIGLLAAVAVVVPVESAVRRRRQLSEVLRAGEQ